VSNVTLKTSGFVAPSTHFTYKPAAKRARFTAHWSANTYFGIEAYGVNG